MKFGPKQMNPWDYAVVRKICTENGLPTPRLVQYLPRVKRKTTAAGVLNKSRRRRRSGLTGAPKVAFSAMALDAKVALSHKMRFEWKLGTERRPEYSDRYERISPHVIELRVDSHYHTIEFWLGQVYFVETHYHVTGGTVLVEYAADDKLSYIPAMILNALIHDKEGCAQKIMVELMRLFFSEKQIGAEPDTVIGLDHIRKVIVNTMHLKLNVVKSRKLGLARRHILLYGAPGNGKTLLIRNICHEFQKDAIIVYVRGFDEFEKWVPLLSLVADVVSIPIILIADEIDEMAQMREQASRTFEFLRLMDGVVAMPNVIFLATTNRPDLLDPALLRPERFSPAWEVSWPDEITRRLMFTSYISRYKKIGEAVARELAKMTEKWSGADIRAAVEDVVYDIQGDLSRFSIEAVRARIRERAPEIRRIHDYWNILIGKWRKVAQTSTYIG
jgi:hypothetical protein